MVYSRSEPKERTIACLQAPKNCQILNSNFKVPMTMLIKTQTWAPKAQTLGDIPITLSITELLYNLAFLLKEEGCIRGYLRIKMLHFCMNILHKQAFQFSWDAGNTMTNVVIASNRAVYKKNTRTNPFLEIHCFWLLSLMQNIIN